MAKVTVQGLGTYMQQLNKLAADTRKINRGALGDAAEFVADRMKTALEGMPTYEDWYGTEQYPIVGATESEKEQIISNFGISKFREDGGKTNTSIGFTGYVNTPSTRFGDQVPTGMLMQCINYGTEFRTGTHTIDHATRGIKGEVEKIIQEHIDDEVSKIVK